MRKRSYFVSYFYSEQEGKPVDMIWRPESCYLTREANFTGVADIGDILGNIKDSTGYDKVVILNIQCVSVETRLHYFSRRIGEIAMYDIYSKMKD